MTWLVTGGAGYIGSHVVRALLGAGESAVVLDDLSTGTKDRVPAEARLELGSVRDRAFLDRVLAGEQFAGVVHIAAKKQVGESVAKPLWYYEENVDGLRILLEATVAAGVKRFLFSSSAAVYGAPPVDLVTEETTPSPVSPYGETKLVGEMMIRAAAVAYGLSYVNLRYFNVAGAGAPDLGDPGATNLIPMVFSRLEAGQAPQIFGDDYATPDGTCIRDYIHVSDVADAHAAAAKRLLADESAGLTLNVGRGEGVSVKQIMAAIRSESGIAFEPEVVARRPGDPAAYAAVATRITEELGWTARHDLTSMVSSAWVGWRFRHDG
jgi:UDP-glucose 4-epimerase